jgi:AcrR family transcriptional regulator
MQALNTALATPQPKPRRIPAAKVRQRMMKAGLAAAIQAGVGVSLENVSMEDVIQRARVPRSSVYRLWPYKSDFIAELMVYLAGPGGYMSGRQVFNPATYDVAHKVMADNRDLLGTPAGRRRVLCEVVRQAVTTNFQAMLDDQVWRVHDVLLATLNTIKDDSARTAVAGALEQGESQARQHMVGLIKEIMDTVGIRIRVPGMRIEHLVVAGVSLLQSLAERHVLTTDALGPDWRERTDGPGPSGSLIAEPLSGPPGIGGEPSRWTLPALSYLALVDSFSEPDPAFEAA